MQSEVWQARRRHRLVCNHNSTRFRIPLQPAQVRLYLGCVLVAKIRVFFQCLVDDVFQLGWNGGVQANRRLGCAIQNRFEDHAAGVAVKWQCPGTHLVHDRPE